MKAKSLFNQLCCNSTLLKAWAAVKAKGSAGGVDGKTIADVDEHIAQCISSILSDLRKKRWKPEPYLKVSIPKKDGEKRQLGMLTVKDKIVHQAIKMLIEPRFEKLFVKNSYGYRPGKGHAKAIGFTQYLFKNKKCKYILRLDIDNYFDTIVHEILFKRALPLINDLEVFRLVQICIKMGMVNGGNRWSDITAGVPQGAVLSPLFANLYLHSFDQFVLSRTELYVRYADDFIIGCETREQAEKLLTEASAFLQERLQLKLNEPEIVEASSGVEFLGITVSDKGLSLSQTKRDDLHQRLCSLKWSDNAFDKEGIERLQGIKNYYARLLPEQYLEDFDMILTQHLHDVISAGWASINSKNILKDALKEILFFSQKLVLERSAIIKDLLDHYTEIKASKVDAENQQLNKRLIAQRKREYRKKENADTELVVNTFGTYIGVNSSGITVKVKGQNMPVSSANLRHITILSKGVSISSNAIVYCMQNSIGIDFFSGTGKHEASVLSNAMLQSSLWKSQADMTDVKKLKLAKSIIQGKLRNQLNLVKYFHKYHKSTSDELVRKYNRLLEGFDSVLKELKSIGVDDYRTSIISLEARGAELYWGYIEELIKDDDVGFVKRTRQGATDLVNSMLNYGYAILYARVWRAVLYRRLNPSDSVLHVPQSGKPTFVYDIIELFRAQAVDRVVISLVQKGLDLNVDKSGKLDDVTKNHLIMSISERLARYERYRTIELKLVDIIGKQVKEIADFIADDTAYRPYIAKW